MTESIVFYKSYFDSAKVFRDSGMMTDSEYAMYVDLLTGYAFNDEKPEQTDIPVIDALLAVVLPVLEAAKNNQMNGRKGGAPQGNHNASKNKGGCFTPCSEKTSNVNVNDNENDNEKDNVNGENKTTSFSLQEVKDYCEKNGFDINVKKFYFYNASKNWCVGGKPVTDFRPLIELWEEQEKEYNAPKDAVKKAEQQFMDSIPLLTKPDED